MCEDSLYLLLLGSKSGVVPQEIYTCSEKLWAIGPELRRTESWDSRLDLPLCEYEHMLLYSSSVPMSPNSASEFGSKPYL